MPAVSLDPFVVLKVQSALIAYDERQKANAARPGRGRGYYNPYALGIYMTAWNRAKSEIQHEGKTIAQSLYDNFNGRLLTALEKAAGLPVTYGGGGHDKGRPTY